MPRIGKSTETESSLVLCYSLGNGGIAAKRWSISICGDENVLKLIWNFTAYEYIKIIKLYNLNGWIVWYVNYSSINMSMVLFDKVITFMPSSVLLWILCTWEPARQNALTLILSTFLVAQTVKHLPAVWETGVWALGWEDPLEKEMATYSSTFAGKSTWTEEPGWATVHGVTKSQTWLNNFTFFLPLISLLPTQSSIVQMLLYLFSLLPGNQTKPTHPLRWQWQNITERESFRGKGLSVVQEHVCPQGVRRACLRLTFHCSGPYVLDSKYVHAQGQVLRPLSWQTQDRFGFHSPDKS